MTSIVILTTGGTLDKVYFDAKGGYQVGASVVKGYLKNASVNAAVKVVELFRKDSLEMTESDRKVVLDAISQLKCSRIIVTHGTDTMLATAHALRSIHEKTIVLTGALQPGRFTDSDGPFNLGMAVAAVQALPFGIYIAANGLLVPAERARKNLDRNRFEDIGSSIG